jgi:hypothetical protein
VSGNRRMNVRGAAVAPAVLKPASLPKPPTRALAIAALALVLLALSIAFTRIDHGGPAECAICIEPAWPLP